MSIPCWTDVLNYHCTYSLVDSQAITSREPILLSLVATGARASHRNSTNTPASVLQDSWFISSVFRKRRITANSVIFTNSLIFLRPPFPHLENEKTKSDDLSQKSDPRLTLSSCDYSCWWSGRWQERRDSGFTWVPLWTLGRNGLGNEQRLKIWKVCVFTPESWMAAQGSKNTEWGQGLKPPKGTTQLSGLRRGHPAPIQLHLNRTKVTHLGTGDYFGGWHRWIPRSEEKLEATFRQAGSRVDQGKRGTAKKPSVPGAPLERAPPAWLIRVTNLHSVSREKVH